MVCVSFSREAHRIQEMLEEKGGVDEREAGVGGNKGIETQRWERY